MLNWIDQRLPLRFLAFFVIVVLWVLSALQLVVGQASFLWVLLLSALVLVGIRDLQQTHHAILRNYPIMAICGFYLNSFGPNCASISLKVTARLCLSLERNAHWFTPGQRAILTRGPLVRSWMSEKWAMSG